MMTIKRKTETLTNAPRYPNTDAARAPIGGPANCPKVRKVWKKPISADILSRDEEEEIMIRPTVEIPPNTPCMILRISNT
jgi:hypothetical protein